MHSPTDFGSAPSVDIIAFHLHEQEFCVKTTMVREIRGWAPCTPIPHAPENVLGVMNLRGTVFPIIDLAGKLGMGSNRGNERCAIVVADVDSVIIGLVVDRVSDILTIEEKRVQPVPPLAVGFDARFTRGMIAQNTGMTCFLDLSALFCGSDLSGDLENAAADDTRH
ncbi:chemotaxis protein CheW [Rhizobium sp. Leaf311]|uniref:chemotaxis protein CheW n=1 Tax=Rhizobium sp. Leaf311 TaxID=1736332 RepID=UPI000ABD0DEC|nr:chemotaxis protein CheW [Rhizobium sp. Leaf311]